MNNLFVHILTDSEIARKFQLGATKIELLKTLGQLTNYILAFNESLNKVKQTGQWTGTFVILMKLLTRYLGSQFLGHATAIDLVDALKFEIKQLSYQWLVQVSMDGLSVNWTFLDELKLSLERYRDDLVILDIVSFSLHVA